MAGLWNGPIRGGTRGGKDQFEWSKVKDDKHRELYLGRALLHRSFHSQLKDFEFGRSAHLPLSISTGHSVMAPTGRWQKGPTIFFSVKLCML